MLHQHHQHFPTSSSTPTSLDEPGEAVAAGVVVAQSCDVDGEPDDGTMRRPWRGLPPSRTHRRWVATTKTRRDSFGGDCRRARHIGVGSPRQRRGETVLAGHRTTGVDGSRVD
jgi:hypothetical protein